MKKVMFTAAVAAMFLLGSAQITSGGEKMDGKKGTKKEMKKKVKGKEHVCTAACKDGQHAYAHGEKGHVCTEECHKKM